MTILRIEQDGNEFDFKLSELDAALMKQLLDKNSIIYYEYDASGMIDTNAK
jgi:hypothetical protein